MKKYLVLLFVVASMQSQARDAQDLPFTGSKIGLGPSTAYKVVVTGAARCNPERRQVRASGEIAPGNQDWMYVHKCDGSILGWVTKIVDGSQLQDDPFMNDPYDMKITRFPNDPKGDYINIYICGDSRKDELSKHPEVQPATNAIETYERLQQLRRDKKKFEIQLFLNEFIYSGKCIGGIKELP